MKSMVFDSAIFQSYPVKTRRNILSLIAKKFSGTTHGLKVISKKHEKWNEYMIPYIENLFHQGKLKNSLRITGIKKKIHNEMKKDPSFENTESEDTIERCLIEIFGLIPFEDSKERWIENNILKKLS